MSYSKYDTHVQSSGRFMRKRKLVRTFSYMPTLIWTTLYKMRHCVRVPLGEAQCVSKDVVDSRRREPVQILARWRILNLK